MKVSFKKTLLAAVALTTMGGLFASTTAAADESPWLVRVRMLEVTTQQSNDGGGIVTPDSVKVANRTQPEVDVSYFFTHNISAELIASYPLSHQVHLNQGGTSSYLGGFQELPPILNLQYHFDGMGAFVPYVGAGVVYMRTMNTTLSNGLSLQQNNFGEDLQLGADYKLDNHWLLNADIKKTWINVGLNGPAGVVGSSTLQLHPDPYILGLGVGYRF
ncbi:MAG: OmpW family protein [Ferrovum sp.]|nr:OmpW family protein [Ferrovum sp.]NDU87661.1 OmpW family protein [Ferrovum sp.]